MNSKLIEALKKKKDFKMKIGHDRIVGVYSERFGWSLTRVSGKKVFCNGPKGWVEI